jgi:hypothetical protein
MSAGVWASVADTSHDSTSLVAFDSNDISLSTMTRTVPSQLAAVATLLAAACASEVDSDGRGGGAASSAETSSTGGGGSDDYSGPEACRDVKMFESPACLDALRARCAGFLSADECSAAAELPLGDPSQGTTQIECRWADVVVFDDLSLCSVQRSYGRCEAVLPQFDHLCGGEACKNPSLRTAWRVLPDAPMEMVRTNCGVPLGYWCVIGHAASPEEGVCMSNVEPPAPPLCECDAAACDFLGDSI